MIRHAILALVAFSLGTTRAEVIEASEEHFVLVHEEVSPLAPDALWDRLMEPALWWDPNHTYSGDAANLSMEDTAGSYWREDWDTGSVIHGQVLLVKEGEELILSAAFGPLISTAADCRWTIRLEATENGGTLIKSSHTVAGAPGTGLEDLADPVDFVMGNGIKRLAAAE